MRYGCNAKTFRLNKIIVLISDIGKGIIPVNICICALAMRKISCWIIKIDRIILAIGKHIIAQHALSGGGVGICIDESAQFGIVIAGLEVIEGGFSVVNITRVRFGT